jgi:predicted Zn-dependent peptidase
MIITQKDNLDRVIFEIIFENSGALFAKEGLANFLAKTLQNRGSNKNPNTKFLSKLEDNAIHLSVAAGRETITIHTSFLKEKQTIALKLLKELLSSPNFTEDSFQKTKKEIEATIQRKQTDFDYIANINLNKCSFKNTPLEYPIMGEKLDFNLEDIKAHFKKFFIKENMTFIVGGNFNPIDFDEFKILFPNGKKEKIPHFSPITSNIETIKPTEQAYIYFNSPYNVEKKEHYKAKIASFILGAGGFGSRIMEEIRVKNGFAYSAYARNSFTNHTNLLKGHMQTKLENEKDAINKLKYVITDFIENGITNEELIQAKQFLIGSEPLRNETLNQKLARSFNEYYNGYEKGYYKKELKLIEDISLNELNNFIKNHNEILNLSFSIVKNDTISKKG